MGIFGKTDDSTPPGSLWNRLMKNYRKQEQKSNTKNSISNSVINKVVYARQTQDQIKIFEDSKKENFRLSLQSLRTRPFNLLDRSDQQYQTSYTGPEQLHSRLRTSKLQCEQLKKKVATISLECNKLERQCRDLKEVKEHLSSFQSDINMLKRKEKITAEIQQRLNLLDEENSMMRDQIEKLRIKMSDFDSDIDPKMLNKRLESLESDSHHLTSITLQTRRDHDNFSLDVGNQLVETFITQQTIYEEFRKLHHRLVSVERQNQIMADLIHLHCHNSTRGIISGPITNSDSSRGLMSMQASTEAASSLFSPLSSDREAEKIVANSSNIDWQFTDQYDSLFLCDTLNKSSEPSDEIMSLGNKCKDYYKIDFTDNTEFLSTSLPVGDLSNVFIGSRMEVSDERTKQLYIWKENCDIISESILNKCCCFQYDTISSNIQTNCQKDDGYYSTSHDGTITKNGTILIFDSETKSPNIFLDKKERYFILTKHLQKSRGRSKRIFSVFILMINYSLDLETKLHNRNLRQKQLKQRESQPLENEEETQVFSDTELYGTRFCIDSDLEDDEFPPLIRCNKVLPVKKSFNYGHSTIKSLKNESKHISSLPPLIEHVSERERKIEIRSSKQSRIIPPRIRPKSLNACLPNSQKVTDVKKSKEKSSVQKSETQAKIKNQCTISSCNNNSKDINSKKPPKGILSLKSYKIKTTEPTKLSQYLKLSRIPITNNDVSNPPPIPPRLKKKTETFCQLISERDFPSLDYANNSQIRMSPEGCPDINVNESSSSKTCLEPANDHKLKSNFSSTIDEYYIEEELDEKTNPRHINEFEDYLDQEFISELENYQLPNSSVNMLVLQHFK